MTPDNEQWFDNVGADAVRWGGLLMKLSPGATVAANRVLCVDANPESRQAFTRLNENRGYQVDLAQDGVEAISLAIEYSYDVIVVDQKIENTARFSLIRQLRTLQHKSAFLISFSRGHVDLPSAAEDDGIAGLVDKPWLEEELRGAMKRAFELCSARLAHATQMRLSPGGQRTALVIGSKDDAELVHTLLADCPYLQRIEHAERLSEGLSLLGSQAFSVVVAELSLPDARGLDSIVQIQHASPDTPVIAFSDLDDDALAIQAMHAGAQDFVVKHGSSARTFQRMIRYAMERHKAQRQLNYLASHDPLTTLANRALFEERLNLTLARASRKQTQFAILYVDLDRFKLINDTLGHEVGDTVLAVTSSRLEDEVREYDTVARLGGDEFAILIDTINGPTEAQAVAERVQRTMQVPFHVAGHTLEITGSIGISVFPLHGESTGQLLRAADSAMYRAKRSGGSGFRFYSPRASNPVEAPAESGVSPLAEFKASLRTRLAS